MINKVIVNKSELPQIKLRNVQNLKKANYNKFKELIENLLLNITTKEYFMRILKDAREQYQDISNHYGFNIKST